MEKPNLRIHSTLRDLSDVRLLTLGRHLVTKIQDEMRALQLCQSKVRQKKLPMEVIDAEYQWYAPISMWSCLSLTAVQGSTKTDFLLYCGETH